MHHTHLQLWQHQHIFNQDQKRPGEQKTFFVIALASVMMIAEIAAGLLTGSMALLADGLHMASHTTALSINAFAYRYARRHASDGRFSFGTGKVNALGGFTGAVLLGVFALMMAGESMKRVVSPVSIVFNQAILVAVIGLIVNGISMFILNADEKRHPEHPHEDHDHNLKSAHLHVMADALTSLLAIFALFMAKYFGLIWMDPLMGIVGAVLVCRWSFGLLRATGGILLDQQAGKHLETKIKEAIESDGDSRVSDLHLWAVGPEIYSAIISVVARNPREPEHYKRMISSNQELVHMTVEVCKCKDGGKNTF